MTTNEDLLLWINKMPLWFRKAVCLYYDNNHIDENDIKELVEYCICDKNDFKVGKLNLINHEEKKRFLIKNISSIQGVNALSPSSSIDFDEGITVVYGLNGSGKSGYIRILKAASGAKYREEIKNNIYIDEKISPKSIIKLESDGKAKTLECDLNSPGEHEVLRGVDIFDTQISDAYINDAKEATYEPWIFNMLSTLANVADRIKQELKNRAKQYEVVPCSFPEHLKNTCEYSQLENLTYKSDVKDFPAEWTEEEENELIQLKKKSQPGTIKSKIRELEIQVRGITPLEDYFEPFCEYFNRYDSFIESAKCWKQALKDKEDAEKLFSDNASEEDSNNIKLESWKHLWEYARQYVQECNKEQSQSSIILDGKKCPLCLQDIREERIVKRMKSIDEYVNGKVVEQEKIKRDAFEKEIKDFPALKEKNELETLIELAGISKEKEFLLAINAQLDEYYRTICENCEKFEKYNEKSVDVQGVLDILSNNKKEIENKRKKLSEFQSSEAQEKLNSTILQLEARKHLFSLYPYITDNIARLKKQYDLEQAEKKATTNKITAKSKELAKEMITNEYIQRFETELDNLTKKGLRVSLVPQKAGKGKNPYRVMVTDVHGKKISPQDILSEGENRVASLAAFFAEASGRTENTPLIIDDPISSLDYIYENKVAERLVDAAKTRQVIVFTHRISMVVGLYEKAKINDIKYKEITLKAKQSIKGVPSEYSDIGGKAKSVLNSLINNKLKKLKGMDQLSEEYKCLFHNICQDFRNVVEKSVEDILLNGIVKRFRRDIQTKNKLSKLAKITQSDCEMFDDFMTRYSYYDHSMSDETPLVELSFEDLEGDLNKLKSWIEEY